MGRDLGKIMNVGEAEVVEHGHICMLYIKRSKLPCMIQSCWLDMVTGHWLDRMWLLDCLAGPLQVLGLLEASSPCTSHL